MTLLSDSIHVVTQNQHVCALNVHQEFEQKKQDFLVHPQTLHLAKWRENVWCQNVKLFLQLCI